MLETLLLGEIATQLPHEQVAIRGLTLPHSYDAPPKCMQLAPHTGISFLVGFKFLLPEVNS
jgi:hypothetical protein